MINNLLVEKYRPRTLDDIILSPENREIFNNFKKKKEIPNLLLVGKNGIGKTSISKLLVKNELQCDYLYINASDENGIDTIRNKISSFARTAGFLSDIKVVIFDEADALTAASQDALRNMMEEYSAHCRFIFTGNYANKISVAIKSRCQEFDLTPPLEECVKRCAFILKNENIKISDSSKDKFINLIKNYYPDLRKIINNIQKYSNNGLLEIPDKLSTYTFSTNLCNKIRNNDDPFKLRGEIIQSEVEFNNDYHDLLKGLYESFYESTLHQEIKQKIMIIIGQYLYKHTFVMDHEINAYTCILEIYDALNSNKSINKK